jgi:DNA-binding CsgD family transcriptional regulator
MVERGRELDALARCLREVRGEVAQVIVIEGVAGVGKTALVDAAREQAEAEAFQVLWARARHLATAAPYDLLRRMLWPTVERLGGPEGLTGAAAFAAPLFTPGATVAAGVDYGCQGLLASVAERGPLLVAVDDAHWADADSLRVLADTAEDLERAPLAIVVACRPAASPLVQPLLARLATLDAAYLVRPAPLSPAGVAEVLRGAFGEEPDDTFALACAQASGGNAFYLRELVRPLISAGQAPAAAVAGKLATTGPDALVRTVRARLNDLGADATALAQAAAVLGDETGLRHVVALAELEPGPAGYEAERLEAAAILARPDPIGFAHPLVRAAVEQTVGPGALGALHARAAQILQAAGAPPSRVAQHLLLAPPDASPAVVDLLMAEARRALDSGSATAAHRLLHRALVEPPSPEVRPEVLLALAEAERAVGDPAMARTHLTEVIETAPREMSITAMAELYEVLHEMSDDSGVLRLVERALAAAPWGSQPAELRLRGLMLVQAARGRADQAPPELFDLDLAALPMDSGEHRRLLICAAIQRRTVGTCTPEEFVDHLRRAAQGLPDGRPLTHWEVQAALDAAAFLASMEEMADAEAVLDRLRPEVFRMRGTAPDLQADWTNRTVLNTMRCGRFEEALGMLAGAEEFAARHGLTVSAGMAHYARGCIDLERGDYLEAGRHLLRVPAEQTVLGALGELLSGRPEQALARLDLDTSPDAPVTELEMEFEARLLASHAWELCGDRAAALREAERELSIRREHGPPYRLALALRRRATFAPAREAVTLLGEAMVACAGTARLPVLARVQASYGSALRRAGRLREARIALASALDLTERIGMTRLHQRTVEELRHAGGRARRSRVTGVESLTEGQAAVARLAAAGRTNREIAESLYVTVKTVETHLAAVYRKLSVPGRDHLGAALG